MINSKDKNKSPICNVFDNKLFKLIKKILLTLINYLNKILLNIKINILKILLILNNKMTISYNKLILFLLQRSFQFHNIIDAIQHKILVNFVHLSLRE